MKNVIHWSSSVIHCRFYWHQSRGKIWSMLINVSTLKVLHMKVQKEYQFSHTPQYFMKQLYLPADTKSLKMWAIRGQATPFLISTIQIHAEIYSQIHAFISYSFSFSENIIIRYIIYLWRLEIRCDIWICLKSAL